MAAELVTIVTGIKYEKRVNESRHSVQHVPTRKRAYLFRFSTFSGDFPVDEPTKRFPFTAEPKFLQILTKRKVPFILAAV